MYVLSDAVVEHWNWNTLDQLTATAADTLISYVPCSHSHQRKRTKLLLANEFFEKKIYVLCCNEKSVIINLERKPAMPCRGSMVQSGY